MGIVNPINFLNILDFIDNEKNVESSIDSTKVFKYKEYFAPVT